VRDEVLGLAVHGQGFARREVTDDLASAYPAPVTGFFNVGLLHTCLDGRPGHDPYAPCSVRTLVDKGYDYWALGHVHAREVVHEDPWIVYPGNLQGRHARETGPKGATVVTVEDGRVVSVDARTLDAVRWEVIAVDAAEAASADDVVDLLRNRIESAIADADGRLLAARVVVTGASAAHDELSCDPERWENEVRRVATEVSLDAVWIEQVRLSTLASFDLAAVRERDDAIGQLARSLVGLRDDDAGLEALLAELAELDKKLPREAREGVDGLRLDDPAFVRELLGEVEQALIPTLMRKGEGS
jgi:DNA repair exonuclease SbcCD nuclease subunit